VRWTSTAERIDGFTRHGELAQVLAPGFEGEDAGTISFAEGTTTVVENKLKPLGQPLTPERYVVAIPPGVDSGFTATQAEELLSKFNANPMTVIDVVEASDQPWSQTSDRVAFIVLPPD
jgi:hypothetical protein